MNNHNVIGVDLAKTVFQVAIMNDRKIISNKKVKRAALLKLIAKLPVSTMVMEACYSAHYWAREFEALGHTVKLIPAQHVKPFTRGNKTDANDAIAIIEAFFRPNLRFVPIKTTYQQDIQCLHRIRERLVRSRTGLTNQTRGLLAEYGIVAKVGKKGFLLAAQAGLNDDNLSEIVKTELHYALEELQHTSDHIANIEARLRAYVSQEEDCQILHSMPGIGVINASALVCKYGNCSQFSKAESLPVSLGITPKLSSSGLRHQMQGISKRGDPYLRKQLIHGARALLNICDKRPDDALCRWASRLKKRRGNNIAVVAVANRLARLAWVLLQKREMYRAMPV
ncbi:MAG: transposase [Arenicella sp.]|jgi:transposase